MTISQFSRQLQKIDPRLRIRIRGYGDIAGLFVGKSGKGGYIARLTKGEFNINGYREVRYEDGEELSQIKKRGRKTTVNKLRKFRWVTNYKQRTALTYGVNYPEEELRGITRRSKDA